jgi:hypothetical protein
MEMEVEVDGEVEVELPLGRGTLQVANALVVLSYAAHLTLIGQRIIRSPHHRTTGAALGLVQSPCFSVMLDAASEDMHIVISAPFARAPRASRPILRLQPTETGLDGEIKFRIPAPVCDWLLLAPQSFGWPPLARSSVL